ncbi:MAG: membrane protein insertion efficiency factor YidD [Planctomycetia bacterium]|jgi:hypothetical protein
MQPIRTIVHASLVIALAAVMAACAHAPSGEGPGAPPGDGFYDGVVGFYAGTLNHLSAVRRGSCPMHPSCSQYSRQAVRRNGLLLGWIMTMDRLLRCGRDELTYAPLVFAEGTWKYDDPVERNELWNAPAPASHAHRHGHASAPPPDVEAISAGEMASALRHPAYRIDPAPGEGAATIDDQISNTSPTGQ